MLKINNIYIIIIINKPSNIIDHATTEQRHAAINCVRVEAAKASNLPVTAYFPIAHSLLTIDESVRS